MNTCMKIHQAVAKIVKASPRNQQSWATAACMDAAQLSKFLNGRKTITVETLENLLSQMNTQEKEQFHLMVLVNSGGEESIQIN